MLSKSTLQDLYGKGFSMMEIAQKQGVSASGVRYWMDKYGIERRSISDANYIKSNPSGDPFSIKELRSKQDFALFNLGIGLFLGEGTKKNKFNVVLANSDPELLKLFLRFLREICRVKKEKIRAWLNVFDDVNVNKTLKFWSKETKIPLSNFNKSTIRKSRGGSYKNKSPHGTLTIFVANKKLKMLMDSWCKEATDICAGIV